MKRREKHGLESENSAIQANQDEIAKLQAENIILKKSVENMQFEIESYRQVPLIVADVRTILDKNAIIKLSNGNVFYVSVSPSCSGLRANDTVLVEQKNLSIVRKIPSTKEFGVESFLIIEKPKIRWEDVGGLSEQANEIKEVIELPLKHPELFKKVGITPPKGILLYGPPGTGKTMLAKAVAASTNSTFIEIVSSELVQKFIGEGAKLVREIFELAKEKAPSIIFIDEIDALAAVRVDIGTSGEREVQRTFMQLLSEIDGFKPLGDVKIIGCTNREDLLDPAITRPGRLDRKIEISIPNERGIREIFMIHTKNMNLRSVDINSIVQKMKGFSGAEIKACCTESGYFAIRNERTYVSQQDFIDAVKKVRQKEGSSEGERLAMFG
ncbi:MAG: AAA family ATPase [Candidatus Woesearchaeota archaeon]|nr:AAA family ATPase [Candidatus Woesearchaeota archaeon]